MFTLEAEMILISSLLFSWIFYSLSWKNLGHFGEDQLRGIGDTGTIEGKESANDKSVRKGKKMDLIRNKKRLFDEIKYYCEENKLDQRMFLRQEILREDIENQTTSSK